MNRINDTALDATRLKTSDSRSEQKVIQIGDLLVYPDKVLGKG